MKDLERIRRDLHAVGQEHLLAFADELDAKQLGALLEQIDSIELDRVPGLIETHVKRKPETGIPPKIEPPEIVPPRPEDPGPCEPHDSASARGEERIAAGKVACLVVAGGQGTRLGFEGPKGCFEATPVTGKPLFQIFAEQILAASRRHGVDIPWYVMTSPANDVATRAFFRQKNHFGLDPGNVFFFRQGAMPAFDFDGKILLAARDRVAMSPDGHGGTLKALRRSGALEDMAERGIELVSYFQVDNPLVHCVDPLFLGLHDQRGAEMGAKSLPKRDPMEKLGNFCVIDGKVHVIEYSDMPEHLARATTDDGRLLFRAGSIAIHTFSRTFLERLTAGGDCKLPLHRAEKRVPHIDPEGNPVQPDEPNAVKLEMFIFDAMPMASETVILETRRDEEFSPIKNATGEDSPATSLHDQVRRAAAWLERAGVTVPRDADGQVAAAIEISPLYADSAEELARKVDPEMTLPAGDSLYLH